MTAVALEPRESTLVENYLARHDLASRIHREVHAEDEMWQHLRRTSPHGQGALAYFRSGHQALQAVTHALAARGSSWGDTRRMLDFACGYGRCARFFATEIEADRLWVSDIDATATDILARSLGAHGHPSVTEPEDFHLETDFDLIFVGSLFSHLPERTFGAWLRKLYDLLSPDGMLLFSTHGMQSFPDYADPSGFRFAQLSETERLDLAEYGSTFATPNWVQAKANALGLGAIYSRANELWELQDLHAAFHHPEPSMASWTPAPIVSGGIVSCEVTAGEALVVGNANLHEDLGDVQAIRLALGEGSIFDVPFRAAGQQQAPLRSFEWALRGPTTGVPAGPHPIHVGAELADGTQSWFDVGLLELP